MKGIFHKFSPCWVCMFFLMLQANNWKQIKEKAIIQKTYLQIKNNLHT